MDSAQQISYQRKFHVFYNLKRKPKKINKNDEDSKEFSHYLKLKQISSPLKKNILIIFIIITFISIVNPKTRKIESYLQSSEITLKINRINGNQDVLHPGDHPPEYPLICPDYIYLNDDETNNLNSNCYFIYIPDNGNSINKVKLIWNSKLNNTIAMFHSIGNIIEVDLSKFDSSEVENIDHMFHSCSSITSINFQNFNSSKVSSMECAFYGCVSLKELDLSSFNTLQLTNMRLAFFGCEQMISVNLTSFDTSEVKTMEYLFFQCKNLKNLSLSNFNTAKVEKMNFMFFECRALESLDLTKFDTSSLTEMEFMFGFNEFLTSLDLSSFNTSNVNKMPNAFEGCTSLMHLNLSNFDTREVVNMNNLFKNCNNLKYLDLSSFHTPKLTSMDEMFSECHSLTSLDISNFQTSQITTMYSLFKNLRNLLRLNLSSFDTSNVENMEYMFSGCSSLFSLDLSNFNLNSLTVLNHMFEDCTKIEFINFINYNDLSSSAVIDEILEHTPENIVICIHNESDTEKLIEIINKKICPTIYCGDDWRYKKKIIGINNTCLEYHMLKSTATFIISTNLEPIESTEISGETTQTPGTTEENTELNLNTHSTTIKESNHNDNNSDSLKVEENDIQESTLLSTIKINDVNLTAEEINQKIYEEITENILQNYDGSNGEEVIIKGEDDFIYRLTTTDNMFEDNNETI